MNNTDNIWVIPTQTDLAVTLTILDYFPCNTLKGIPKKCRTRILRFFEKNFGVNITQNNLKKNLKMFDNWTLGRY